jgi:mono/diheme cytochrome c family protein
MPVNTRRPALIGFSLGIAVVALCSFALAGRAQRTAAQASDVVRGKYLVDNVAMCTECHTPRDSEGNLEMQSYLEGAPIWIVPTKHIPDWAQYAPVLAGLPSYTDEQMENVLERGIALNGGAIRPPMHIYHMNPEDAKAIISYLKSLPVQKR